jgi:hypothetical protein
LSFPLGGYPSDSTLVKGDKGGCFEDRFSMRVFAKVSTTGLTKVTAGKQDIMTEKSALPQVELYQFADKS